MCKVFLLSFVILYFDILSWDCNNVLLGFMWDFLTRNDGHLTRNAGKWPMRLIDIAAKTYVPSYDVWDFIHLTDVYKLINMVSMGTAFDTWTGISHSSFYVTFCGERFSMLRMHKLSHISLPFFNYTDTYLNTDNNLI